MIGEKTGYKKGEVEEEGRMHNRKDAMQTASTIHDDGLPRRVRKKKKEKSKSKRSGSTEIEFTDVIESIKQLQIKATDQLGKVKQQLKTVDLALADAILKVCSLTSSLEQQTSRNELLQDEFKIDKQLV